MKANADRRIHGEEHRGAGERGGGSGSELRTIMRALGTRNYAVTARQKSAILAQLGS